MKNRITDLKPSTKKLINTDARHVQTTPKIMTLIFANMPAPIRHTKRLRTFKTEEYRKRHQLPSGNNPFINKPKKRKLCQKHRILKISEFT